MSQISKLVNNDSRGSWERINRRQLWAGAKKLGIEFKAGAKHNEMISLLQINGITPDQVTEFKGEYPEEKERKYDEQKEHRRMEVFEQRIEEATKAENARIQAEKDKLEKDKNSEIDSLKSELDEMKAMMKQLLESNAPAPKPKKGLKDMHWKSFQKLAKTVDIDWSTKDPREPVIAKLEAQDV